MTFFPRVFLNSREEKEINQGFPWVFDNEISHIKTKKVSGQNLDEMEEIEVSYVPVKDAISQMGS